VNKEIKRIYKVVIDNKEFIYNDVDSAISAVILYLNEVSTINLRGELGIGKTFFTQKLLKMLGVKKHITSPTFVIMNEYQIRYNGKERTVRHIDAYRINSEQFLEIIPQDELFDNSFLYLIEWPENIEEVLPMEKRIDVYIENERVNI